MFHDLTDTEGRDIVAAAASRGRFNTLITAIKATGLAATLQGNGPFTLFAPTDEAFAKLPATLLEAVLADKSKLAAVLTYHVLAGRYTACDVAGVPSAPSIQGQALHFSTGPGVRVNSARVLEADIFTSNGVIHEIDSVLLPS